MDKFATYTEEVQPLPGSALRSAGGIGGGSNIALDLIAILDTSRSIRKSDFNIGSKVFVTKLAQAFTMHQNGTKMGAIAFGQSVFDISPITSDRKGFATKVSQFKFKGGICTNTGGALLRAKEMFQNGRQQNTRRVVILITDGRSNCQSRSPVSVAQDLRGLGVETFVFGIGRINLVELNGIASPPSDTHVFLVSDFQQFRELANSIAPGKTM